MDTATLQNQIEELQKQLEDAKKKEEKKMKKREYMREYAKKKYYANLEQSRKLTADRQHKHYEKVRKHKNKAIRVYEYLEDLKHEKPEYLEQIKLILAN